ncbi:hypothetical protein [Listeria fleischmannii]|uniref:Uncharacterized protein n=1 Tax=Listeria fleischmannii FSL S10-1203 TaxID=1265822 RepID=W7DSL6_9LIST|nr:hypothetical protein [Listeria fleischmannii]EUJ64875.1 hypothetical protein MCOL2_01760 [Listeria fleischmannii FSL S10-1203]
MDTLINDCLKVMNLINQEFPSQKQYAGIIKNIYDTVGQILYFAKKDEVLDRGINWDSLIRQFVDETTQYRSPIILGLEKIKDDLMLMQETPK